jgi:hypothetical protein
MGDGLELLSSPVILDNRCVRVLFETEQGQVNVTGARTSRAGRHATARRWFIGGFLAAQSVRAQPSSPPVIGFLNSAS